MTLTMRIESVKTSPDRAGRYTVKFEDGTVLRLYRQTMEDFCPYPGQELNQQGYEKLLDAAGKMSAKMRAVRIVSATSVSKKDLEQRLIHKGENPDDARQAVSWMSDLKLLDDEQTAQQIVRRCISKGYGLARAKQALYEKRIPKSYWDAALEEYPVQNDAIAAYLKDHLHDPDDPKEVRRVTSALIRRGHNYQDIRRELQKLSVDDEFLEERNG